MGPQAALAPPLMSFLLILSLGFAQLTLSFSSSSGSGPCYAYQDEAYKNNGKNVASYCATASSRLDLGGNSLCGGGWRRRCGDAKPVVCAPYGNDDVLNVLARRICPQAPQLLPAAAGGVESALFHGVPQQLCRQGDLSRAGQSDAAGVVPARERTFAGHAHHSTISQQARGGAGRPERATSADGREEHTEITAVLCDACHAEQENCCGAHVESCSKSGHNPAHCVRSGCVGESATRKHDRHSEGSILQGQCCRG